MCFRLLVLFNFAIFAIFAEKPHTSLIPGGYRDGMEKHFPYIRNIDTKNSSCTGVDIGCGFVITAAHCETKEAKVLAGEKSEHHVADVTRTYMAPGWSPPKHLKEWVNGEHANYDIKLLKIKNVEDPKVKKVEGAHTLIDWKMAPLVLDPKKPVEGWIAGYGSTAAEWNNREWQYQPVGDGGVFAWGKVSLDYSGYFTHYDFFDFKKSFGPAKNGKGRICSEPKEGLQTIIQGDSGGPLIGPDGHLRGVISAMARMRKPKGENGAKDSKLDYLSCYVDLAGHLPWIYATMKADGCRTLPDVPQLEGRTRKGDVEGRLEPKKGPPVTLLDPIPLDPETFQPPLKSPAPKNAEENRIRNLLNYFQYDHIQQLAEQARKKGDTRLEKAYRSVYSKNKTDLEMDRLDLGDRDDLRKSVGKLLNLSAETKVVFGVTGKFTPDEIRIPIGFCKAGNALKDCPFEEKGVLVVTPAKVEVRLYHTVK